MKPCEAGLGLGDEEVSVHALSRGMLQEAEGPSVKNSPFWYPKSHECSGIFEVFLARYLDTLVVQKSLAVQVCLVVLYVLQLQESLGLQGLLDVLRKEGSKSH